MLALKKTINIKKHNTHKIEFTVNGKLSQVSDKEKSDTNIINYCNILAYTKKAYNITAHIYSNNKLIRRITCKYNDKKKTVISINNY